MRYLYLLGASLPLLATIQPQIDLYFEPNLGQANPEVRFLARGAGGTTLFTQDKTVFSNLNAALTFKGAKPITNFEPLEELPGVSAYFTGNDPTKWLHKVPHYSKLRARNVYEGIDLVYYAKGTQLEYDLIVHPHADPTQIQLAFEGLKSLKTAPNGDLLLTTSSGHDLIHSKPRVFQTIAGVPRDISASYRIANRTVTLDIASYNRSRHLTIDPYVQYGAILPSGWFVNGITSDAAGAVYLAGFANQGSITAVNSLPGSTSADTAFVSKVIIDQATRSASLIYSTYFGKGGAYAGGVAVDTSGAAYIAGSAYPNADIPLLHQLPIAMPPDTYQTAFLAKLRFDEAARSLSVVYSTRFGGNGSMGTMPSVAVDNSGSAYLSGTFSSLSPNPTFPISGNLPDTGNYLGGSFLSKIQFDPSSSNLSIAYSTFFPSVTGVLTAVDSQGVIYVAGRVPQASSASAIPLINSLPGATIDVDKVWVARIRQSNGVLSYDYATTLGGTRKSRAGAITADPQGNVIICGETSSVDFPLVQQITNRGSLLGPSNFFLTALSYDSPSRALRVSASTVMGGSGSDSCPSVAVGPGGSIYAEVLSSVADFPAFDPIPDLGAGEYFAETSSRLAVFLLKFQPSPLLDLRFSTPLFPWDGPNSFQSLSPRIAIDASGIANVFGRDRFWGPTSDRFPGASNLLPVNPNSYGIHGNFLVRLSDSATSDPPRLTVNKYGSGTVRSTGGPNGNVDCGSVCEVTGGGTYVLTATPDAGFTFLGWQGACSTTGNCQVTVNRARFAVAVFAKLANFTIRITGSGSGKVVGSGINCAGVCTLQLPPREYTLSAIPNPGSIFPGWMGRGQNCSGTLPCQFTVTDGGELNLPFDKDPLQTITGLAFVTRDPQRVFDTRLAPRYNTDWPVPMQPLETRSVSYNLYAVTARAYSLNFTVVPQGPLPYLTTYPAGSALPNVSSLNSLDGRIKANAVLIPAGVDDKINVYATNTTDVIIDTNGYFIEPNLAPSGQGLAFYPLKPCRILDTRNPTAPLGGPALLPQASRTIPILTSACNIPSAARAYSLNTTVVPTGPLPYITLYPTGQALPTVSTLNALLGEITANAAIVPAGSNGSIDIYAAAATHLVMDINGYFAPPGQPGGLLFYPVKPCRILDTRNPTGSFGGPIMGAQETRDFPVPQSACGIPSTAKAYSLNATVVPTGNLPYLTLWPAGDTIPTVSTLNSLDASIVSNAAIVPAGTNGAIRAFTAAQAHLILDINGYFAP